MNTFKSSIIQALLLSFTLFGCGDGDSAKNESFTISNTSALFSTTLGKNEYIESFKITGNVTNYSGTVYIVIELNQDGVVDEQNTYVSGDSYI